MAIEFFCPGCGNLMRTPDETAGRKGRCPNCQLKVQIPGESVASTAPEKPASANPQSIKFDCQTCGKSLSVAASNAGKQGLCPHCRGLMSIPSQPGAAASASSVDSIRGSRWKGAPTSPSPAAKQPSRLTKAGGSKIEFLCSHCKELVRVGAAAAGKNGQCPRCQTVIQIPKQSTIADGLTPVPNPKAKVTSQKPTAKSTDSTPGLTPLPSTPKPTVAKPAAAKPTPTPGLTPLPSESTLPTGLTPLPSEPAATSGLTPLDSSPLSPLEPLGLTPLEPLGGGLGDDPLGVGSFDNSNPFSSPSIPQTTPITSPTRRPNPSRSGLHTATMVCGWIIVAFAAVQLIYVPVTTIVRISRATESTTSDEYSDEEQLELAKYISYGKSVAYWIMAVAELMYLCVLAGGIQMTRFKMWWLGLTSSILCMIPCGCLCVIGAPLGIWGIVMLSQGPVRKSFS